MWDELTFWAVVFAVLNFALSAGVTIHAVLWKRDSRAVIAWVGLAWLAPVVGACAYLCLGINRIERKAVSLKLRDSWNVNQPVELSDEDVDMRDALVDRYPHLVGLAHAGRTLTGRPLLPGNRVHPLIDGDQSYPAMLASIDAAEHSAALLSYIFDSDRAGDAFFEALVRARKRDVEIRILIDDVGSKYSRQNMVRRLTDAGICSASFLPTRVPIPIYANLRNHRKILVVDGRVGFTGGTNIREDHWLDLDPGFPVQCLHFRLEGLVVRQIQQVFAKDWHFATGENLSGEKWFPRLEHEGDVFARGIEHGPDEQFETIVNTIGVALACARDRIRIVTPYFLPNASLIQALNVAAIRGVKVEICLPSANNIAVVQWAASAQLWQLLQKGCEICYTPPPFDHTKLMIVDGIWTLIGSTNWDPRSLRLNFEFNVECYSEQLAESLNEIVDQKVKSARPVTLEEVNGRSLPVRLRDGFARLLAPYL